MMAETVDALAAACIGAGAGGIVISLLVLFTGDGPGDPSGADGREEGP